MAEFETGRLLAAAIVNKLICFPVESVKTPDCANGVRAVVPVGKPPGCFAIENEAKKKSLSLIMCPPTLPPKLLRMIGVLGRPKALLVQLLAFRTVFRKC